MHFDSAYLVVLALLGLGACGGRAIDSVRPAACTREPAALPAVDDSALGAAVAKATHVVRGRVRFSGEAVNVDGDKQLRYAYVIVDTLDYLKGDPWEVPDRYRKSFPLLVLEVGRSEKAHFNQASPGILALTCREEEALWFVMDLPDPEQRPLHEMPDPVRRSFGPRDVKLYAVLPETERDRLVNALSR